MIERVLEKLLQRFLAPYVEGLSNSALRYGVRSGVLELRDLRVKPEALSLLGWPGYSVKRGTIGSVSLHISWKSLFTGRLYIAIDGLYLEAHEEAITPAEMRVLKSKTIDLRMDQIRDMMHHSAAFEAGDQEGFLMRVNRKVLNNLSVNISGVAIWLVTTSCPQALGVKLPGLRIMSTDENAESSSSPRSGTGGTASLDKILKLDGFCFCLSEAGSSEINSAMDVLSPLSACIRLTHAPREKLLKLHVELGSGKQNQITLRHSQWVHFFKVLAEAAEQAQQLQAELVAAEIQRALLLHVEASAEEYGHLYEQDLASVHACGPLLSLEDMARMQMLEDALPVRPLAQQRWLGHCGLRRKRSAERAAKKRQLWSFCWAEQLSSVFDVSCKGALEEDEEEEEDDDGELLKEDVRRRLQLELNAVTRAEEVEPPARSRFHFVLGQLLMELIDDRWASQEAQDLLSLVLPTALVSIELDTVADSQGNEVTEWGVFCDFGAWQARHACKEVLVHLQDEVPVSRAKSQAHQPAEGGGEEVPNAAKLAVESRLDSDSSILKVTFDSTPFEILLLPGMIGRIVEFFTTNGAEEAVHAAMDEHDQAAAEFLEGLDIYQQVQDQIPDRLFLDLSIAAPILRAPVEGRGSLVLCPGHLRLSMPEPCGYSRLEFRIVLSDTVLKAVPEGGENFNMIQPVPIEIWVIIEDASRQIDVVSESLALFLAPEAIEMLLYLPETVNVILDAEVLPPQEVELLEGSPAGGEREPQASAIQPPPALERSQLRHQTRLLEGAAPSLLSDFGMDDGMWRMPSASRVRSTVPIAEASAGRPTTFSVSECSGQLIITTTVCCDRLTLLLADALRSMLRLQLELPAPGLIIKTQRLPEVLTLDVEQSSLELEALNHHHGQWEPVIEVFSFGLGLSQPPRWRCGPQSDSAVQTSVGMEITGLSPLFLNLTPTLFQKVNRSIELVTESVTAASASPGEGRKATKTGAKYRLFNLCGCPFELQFYTGFGAAGAHTVVPTGSDWEPLDKFIMQCFATEVSVRSLDGSKSSRRLQLELDGAAVVPGDGAILELFTPEGDKHRVLLLAPPLRLLNMTEMPMHLRFYDCDNANTCLPHDLEHTMTCKAALLGAAADEGGDDAGDKDSWRACGILPPNALFAVPKAAVRCDPASSDTGMYCWLSVGSTAMEDHSKPVKVGGEIDSSDAIRYKWDQCAEAAEDMYIEWRATLSSRGPSSRCSVVSTVELRPPVRILNAVPIGALLLRYQQSSGKLSNKWFEVSVPPFRSQSLRNVARAAPGDSLFIQARLSENTPWSASVRLPWDRLQGEEAQPSSVQVQHQRRGAPVDLTIEPVDGFKLRFSCPFWFVNCSGIEAPFSLEVHRNKRQLPSEAGLALLPSLCQQEPVDLVLRKEGSVAATLEKQFMPPSWSTLAWAAGSKRSLVFCVQVETIDPVDVFGAEVQAMVLRPRLVLTNYSSDDIELLILGREVEIAAGQSIEYHWPVSIGTDEPPSLELRFRPRSTQPQRQWSSTVVCSDVSAGSTPFLLRAARQADGEGVEVWSVEVAPLRGALAVSFKQGSNFIAMHNAPTSRRRRSCTYSQSHSITISATQYLNQQSTSLDQLSSGHSSRGVDGPGVPELTEMLIRPCGSHNAEGGRFKRSTVVAAVPCLPVLPGVEVPFGWAEPFGKIQDRSVEVIVNRQTYYISDVRNTTVVPVQNTNLVIRVARQGERTLLMLEVDRRASNNSSNSNGGLTLQIQLCQVGISFIEEAPELRELLYVHFEPLAFDYKDTDDDAHELGLRIESAQVDCQLPRRREEASTVGRISRMGKALRSSDIWRPAVVLRNSGKLGQPFLALSLERSATSSGDIVLPKVDLALDKVELHMDDDWLEALIHWSHGLHAKGLEQVVKFADVVIMAGRPITQGYKPPPLPSVVQVESLSISDVKLVIWCRLRLQSLSFLPRYVLSAVRAVSLSSFFTLNGASVSLKRRAFLAHRGSLEDFLAELGAEYGRSVVANIFSILHSSSLLNLPRAPLKIGQGAMTGVSKGLRHMAENAPTPPFVSPKSGNEAEGKPKRAVPKSDKPPSPLKKMLSRMNSFRGEERPRVRRRQPRLLLPAVGELRPWCPLEAAILGQLGQLVCKDLHEVVPLTPAPPVSRWCTVLLLSSEALLVACIDTLPTMGDCARDSLTSLNSCSSRHSDAGTLFFSQCVDAFYSLAEVEQSGIPASTASAYLNFWKSSAGADAQRTVRGLRFSLIERVLQVMGESGPALEFQDITGRTHKLPLPSAHVSESARDTIAEGIQSAASDCDGDVSWTVLRSTLYADRRGLKAGRPPDEEDGFRDVTLICL